jgi:hypothetical protein
MYEMVLGGWRDTTSVVRVGSQGKNLAILVVNSPGWLSSQEFRWFWASAKDGHLKLGKGDVVGLDEIVSSQISNPIDVKYVGFSTWLGSAGEWEEIKFPPAQAATAQEGVQPQA